MRYLEFGRDNNTLPLVALGDSNRSSIEGLTITDYLLPLNCPMFYPHEITLSSVEFYGATLFSNIIQIFSSCSNMTELTFTFVFIDDYKIYEPPSSTTPAFIAPQLTTLEFNRDGALSPDELIILDFLSKFVALPVLKSLIFNVMSYGYNSRSFENEVLSKYGQYVPSVILPKLIIKSAPTIKILMIRRHGFIFLEDEHAQEEIIEGLQNVQLDKLRFQVDTTGIHFLLDGQTHLQKLDCSSHFERSRLKARDFPKLMESLWRGLRQSSDTIRHAHAIGTVAFSSDDEDQNTLLTSNPCFNINLETFENSSCLTNLWLSKMENFPSNSRFFPESFTFSNSHCIPTSLVQLELWVGRVIPEELVKLTLRLQQMMNLCFFKLCSVVPYFLSLECFKNILSVEHSFMQAFFYNGFLHENFCPQQIIMNNRRANRRNWEVKISKGGCEFVCKEPIPRF